MINNSLDQCSKEELIEIIKTLKRQKKFGLVWEDKPEKVATECQQKLPVVKEDIDKAINLAGAAEPTNLIIEGDNYHALSVLNYTHAGKVDVIYIDPPYNTGARDWKYNNKFVDSQDAFRHSKWISLMDKRLRLARNLLKSDGIIAVAIDDYEIATLRLLMDEIFSANNYLGTAVIRNNPSGRSTVRGFSINHEYTLFYSASELSLLGRLPHTDEQKSRYKNYDEKGVYEWENFRKNGTDSDRKDRPKQFYPIVIDQNKNLFIPKLVWNDMKGSYDIFETLPTGCRVIWPKTPTGNEKVWKYGLERARLIINDILLKETKTGYELYRKKYLNSSGSLPRTWWDKPTYSARDNGTRVLSDIFGPTKVFDFPKAPENVKDCLRVANLRKNGVVLDFFAGSGTTGQAVLELNKEDGGHRQFILCTNNENDIAEKVTYPRVKSIITGYTKNTKEVQGISANMRYFRTNFIEKDETLDKLRRKLSPACEDMIRIREGAFDRVIDEDEFKVYKNSRGLTAVIFDRFDLADYIARIEELETNAPVHLYVFSYTNYDRLDELSGDFKHTYESQPIPEGVLEIYKRIFSKGGKR